MSAREKGAEPRKKRKRPARKRMIAVVSVLAIAAIAVAVFPRLQGQLDSGELIAEAEQQFAAGDFSTAIINLKNVVSRDKADARARFLLGRAYIESGNPAAALKELGKARELGERDQELDLGIVRARKLSRATITNIRQNLFFAFVYNALGVPLAAGVLYPAFGILLSPMIAAAAMSLSSVSVISNALRLRGVRL